MRRALPFALFTALHFVLSFGALYVGVGIVMAAFDGRRSDFLASLANLAINVLYFPLVSGLSTLIPGLRRMGTVGGYALFIANSMVWGLAATLFWSWWRTRLTMLR